jgi:hypothetical protein
MPKWLLESNIFQENIELIKKAIISQGMECKEITYVPFDNDQTFQVYDPEECVIFYGSLNLATQIQRVLNSYC